MSETTELFSIEPEAIDAAALYTDRARFGELRERIKGVIDNFEPDLSSETGRGKIASLAYKIAKVKTKVDKTGKDLGDEARAHLNALNAARKEFREELEAMQTAVRAPLTEWEAAEKERLARIEQTLREFQNAGFLPFGVTSALIRERIEEVKAEDIDPDVFREKTNEAHDARDHALEVLRSALTRIEEEERNKAELARLKREEEERLRREADGANRKAAEAEARRRQDEATAQEAAEGPKAESDHPREQGSPSVEARRGPTLEEAAAHAIAGAGPVNMVSAKMILRAIQTGRVPGVKWEG